MKVYLGIDTSCYTTSVAVLDAAGRLVADERRILTVKPGNCGLQQSEMVFQHVRALPELVEAALQPEYEVQAIGVSDRPRPLADSYMPAFLTGLGTARALAKALQVPLLTESHQENHLLAGLWSVGGIDSERFLMLHASGGTTDMLLVERDEDRYRLIEIGGSKDLHAGQFIDRVGVALGLQFPTGIALEKLAQTVTEPVELPVSVQGCQCSLSGPASAAKRLLDKGVDGARLALGVEACLGKTFGRMLADGAAQTEVQDVLLVGGVASNVYICQVAKEILAKKGVSLHNAAARYSCDGAVGNAFFASQKMR